MCATSIGEDEPGLCPLQQLWAGALAMGLRRGEALGLAWSDDEKFRSWAWTIFATRAPPCYSRWVCRRQRYGGSA